MRYEFFILLVSWDSTLKNFSLLKKGFQLRKGNILNYAARHDGLLNSAWCHLVLSEANDANDANELLLRHMKKKNKARWFLYIQRTFYFIHFLKTFSSFLMQWTSRSRPVRVWEHHGTRERIIQREVMSYRRLTHRRSVNLLKPVVCFLPVSF